MPFVSCLYVASDSIYRSLPGCDCWDIHRDARLFDGPGPVIAHPPCGPWGVLAWKAGPLLRSQKPLALLAASQVVAWGGVLEHPVTSSLWRTLGIPFGLSLRGLLLRVDQSDFGFPTRKPTALWFPRPPLLLPPLPPPRPPAIQWHALPKWQRASTPLPLALWLVAAVTR